MKRRIVTTTALILFVLVSLVSTSTGLAQSPTATPGTGTYTTVVPVDVPSDWQEYQDASGNWALKYPQGWTIGASGPGTVSFMLNGEKIADIVMENEPFPMAVDDSRAIDLFAQGVAQSSAGQGLQLMGIGRWLRGRLGMYFDMEAVNAQAGKKLPVAVVTSPFDAGHYIRFTFRADTSQDLTNAGALLASLQPVKKAPPTTQAQQGGTFFGGKGPRFGAVTFDQGLDDQGQPVNPGQTFPAGVKNIDAVFDYSGMNPDTEYTATWFLGNRKLQAQTYVWDQAAQGTGARVSLADTRGLKPGQYRLQITIGDKPLQAGSFEVVQSTEVTVQTPSPTATEEPTITSTEEPTVAPTDEPTMTPTTEAPTDTPTPAPTPTKPRVAASQGKVVYTRVDNNVASLWVMNVNGSGQKKIADYASDPSWSPDGKSIAIYGWDGSPRGGSGIYQINADGTNPRQIWNQGSAEYLNWARSGRYVAMSTTAAGTSNKRLVVYDGKDGTWKDIGPGEQPSFSPDGSKLIARTCTGSDCGLFIMNRDGSGARRVTSSADDAMPAWSPNGKRIAYASQKDSNWDVFVMNVDGSGVTRLTSDPAVDAMPAWLSDGSKLLFRSSRGGSWGVWIMNADGSGQRKIIDAPAGNDWGRARLDVR